MLLLRSNVLYGHYFLLWGELMKTIYFLTLESHTLSGNHLMQFNSKQSRLSYLSSRVKFSKNQNFQEHSFIDELTVPFPIEQNRLVNIFLFSF